MQVMYAHPFRNNYFRIPRFLLCTSCMPILSKTTTNSTSFFPTHMLADLIDRLKKSTAKPQAVGADEAKYEPTTPAKETKGDEPNDYSGMNVKELKELCAANFLDSTGIEGELISRLTEYRKKSGVAIKLAAVVDETDYGRFKVQALKEICVANDLEWKGEKEELVERIVQHSKANHIVVPTVGSKESSSPENPSSSSSSTSSAAAKSPTPEKAKESAEKLKDNDQSSSSSSAEPKAKPKAPAPEKVKPGFDYIEGELDPQKVIGAAPQIFETKRKRNANANYKYGTIG